MFSWRSQKMTNFLTPHPQLSAKISKRSVVSKHKNPKTRDKLQEPPPPIFFHVGVINVWSFALKKIENWKEWKRISPGFYLIVCFPWSMYFCVIFFDAVSNKISNRNTANISLFKVVNRNTRKRCEMCSQLTIKTPEWR